MTEQPTPKQIEKQRALDRAEAREREKHEEAERAGEVRVSGVSDLKVGMLLRDKRDPNAKPMRVVRIIPGQDIAILKPAEPGNRRERLARQAQARRTR